jgi:hypothetical protein
MQKFVVADIPTFSKLLAEMRQIFYKSYFLRCKTIFIFLSLFIYFGDYFCLVVTSLAKVKESVNFLVNFTQNRNKFSTRIASKGSLPDWTNRFFFMSLKPVYV